MKNLIKNFIKIKKEKILQNSFFVAILTLLLFLGFFLRDFLIVKYFGFTSESDLFYKISIIPMFFVGIFCIPFGQALIPFLTKSKRSEFKSAISYFYAISILFCLTLCFISFAIFSLQYFFLKNYFFDQNFNLAFLAFLPLLILSGWLITSNSILSSLHYYLLPSFAQLIVPLSAICFIFLFANSMGIYSVIFGMTFGQVANLLIINFFLKKEEIFLWPLNFNRPLSIKKDFWVNYLHLIALAILTSINLPISSFLASTLGDGALSIFNFGIKFNLFICGILAAIFSSVFLPYLSRAIKIFGVIDLNNFISFLILFTALILTPFSLLFFYYSENLTFLIFHRIIEDKESILELSSVISYSILQLPFWVFTAILVKHGNAISRLSFLVLTSLIVAILNLILGLFFIKFINVAGLSLSLAISSGFGSFLLLFYYAKEKYLSISNALIVILIWSLFIFIIILLNYEKFIISLEKLFFKF